MAVDLRNQVQQLQYPQNIFYTQFPVFKEFSRGSNIKQALKQLISYRDQLLEEKIYLLQFYKSKHKIPIILGQLASLSLSNAGSFQTSANILDIDMRISGCCEYSWLEVFSVNKDCIRLGLYYSENYLSPEDAQKIMNNIQKVYEYPNDEDRISDIISTLE